MALHCGILQVASERDSYGAEAGWTYLARFLNEIPPDQTTIPFLFYFLKARVVMAIVDFDVTFV